MPINVSIKEIIELMVAISSSLKTINDSNQQMKRNLSALGVSFQDEGFDAVCSMVFNSEKHLNDAVPALDYIVTQLRIYIELLYKSQKALNGQGSGNVNSNNISQSTVASRASEQNTDIDIKELGKQWADSLSEMEYGAIKDYTGNGYRNINSVLRGKETEFDSGNYEKAKIIHNVLSNCEIPNDCVVYRGTSSSSLGDYADLSDEELIGQVLIDKGFLSTSLNYCDSFDGEVQYEIYVPAGAKGVYVGYLSCAKHYESEVLFDAKQVIQITDVKSDESGNRKIVARIII